MDVRRAADRSRLRAGSLISVCSANGRIVPRNDESASRFSSRTIFLLMACLLLWAHPAHAQKVFVDSLTRAYRQNHQDTTLVQLYAEKAEKIYITADPDSGMYCVNQGLQISRRIHYKHGELRMMTLKAIYLNRRGGLVESIKITFDVIPQATKTNDERVLAQAYNNLGLCYQVLKNYRKSIDYYLLFIRVAERSHFADYQVTAYNNTARVYFDISNIDSASYYNNKAYATAIRTNNVRNIAYLIRNFGTIAEYRGDHKKAIDYFRKSIIVLKVKTNHYLLSEDNRRLAEAYLHLERTDSALYFARGAYDDGKLDKDPELVMKAADMLASIYSSNGDYKNAWRYQQEKIVNGDSLFSREKSLQVQNLTFNEDQRRQKETELRNAEQARMRFYLLLGILGVFVLIAGILLFANQQRKKANKILQQRNEQIETQHKALEKSLSDLKTTQKQLIQSEKMASLGELTAGIAHEIQNPLNFVNNFSEVSAELTQELKAELKKGNTDDALAIANDLEQNLEKITHHGKRADFIVKGMMQHSRANTGEKQLTDINVLCDEFLKLSYHGLRAKDRSFNAEMVTHFDPGLPKIKVSPQEIGRVLQNLFNNAFYAVNQKQKTAGADYRPEVAVSTSTENGQVVIKVKDNGVGIPDSIKEKIMQPFFTTKPTGQGTGLGLSLTYDMVVKGHGGSIKVDSLEGEGSEFTILLLVS
ncbi:MAG TPA: ATP-binding protein [Mucilaginibacter sp.]|nr:ATP-binding protein [Mucilaginibacter sp.]